MQRVRVLYDLGYVEDHRVFVNPINQSATNTSGSPQRGLGTNFLGPGRDIYFSDLFQIRLNWGPGPIALTPLHQGDAIGVPILWDQRADLKSPINHVRTPDGRYGGFFAYQDGSVELLGEGDSILREVAR